MVIGVQCNAKTMLLSINNCSFLCMSLLLTVSSFLIIYVLSHLVNVVGIVIKIIERCKIIFCHSFILFVFLWLFELSANATF